MYNYGMHSFTISEAREKFAMALTEASDQPVEITRHGIPVAYIVSPDMFHNLTNTDLSHLLVSADVTPARISLDELAALEPAPADGGMALSEVLEQLREERL